MLEASIGKFTYDSANRLITADTRYYVYDVEGTRIKTQKGEDTTKFIYNVNARLSQLLVKTENNADTKYVYGLGLIGEEVSGNFKTYHFDYRGSTVAITDSNCNITDTFTYDTYGKLTARTGTTKTPFLYNGRDGVMYEDDTGLIYMRARYYSPALRRFVNADKLHGDISNSLTLNRYAYVNGNPADNVDPEGLSAERGGRPERDAVRTCLDYGRLGLYSPLIKKPKKNKNYIDKIKSVINLIGDGLDYVFGYSYGVSTQTIIDEKENFLCGYEYGCSTSKGSSNDGIIQFVAQTSISDDSPECSNGQLGIKVNTGDNSGFSLMFGSEQTSLSFAVDDSYFSIDLGLDQTGFTIGSDVNWADNSIGQYSSYYIKPKNIALVTAGVVAAVGIIYVTGGLATPVVYEIAENLQYIAPSFA